MVKWIAHVDKVRQILGTKLVEYTQFKWHLNSLIWGGKRPTIVVFSDQFVG
jgi:hypothetical protein